MFHGGKPDGQGKLRKVDGDSYEGAFRRGRAHGVGKLTKANGLIYEGLFDEGEPHGQGKVTYNFKESGEHQDESNPIMSILDYFQVVDRKFEGSGNYEGMFHRGRQQGEGKTTYPNGNTHEGLYEKGEPHGLGKLTLPDGIIYEGMFDSGKPHG
jgi:hypothetical protein